MVGVYLRRHRPQSAGPGGALLFIPPGRDDGIPPGALRGNPVAPQDVIDICNFGAPSNGREGRLQYRTRKMHMRA